MYYILDLALFRKCISVKMGRIGTHKTDKKAEIYFEI